MTINTKSFSEQVLDQASAWIVRLRSDQVTEQDQQDFALWLAESKQHQLAFDEMMILWEAMGSEQRQSSISALLGKVSSDHGPLASNDCIDTSPPEKQHQSATNKPTLNTTGSNSTTKFGRRRTLGALGSLAASLLVVGFLYFNDEPPTQSLTSPQQTLFATPVGMQQRFVLEDGSSIELNTDSQVSVEYTDTARTLHLIRGEAYFDVEHNPSRPFTVIAGAGQVTAVGTAFNIQLDQNDDVGSLLVAVTEGRVAVAESSSRSSDQSITVDIGHQTRVTGKGEFGEIEPADLEMVSAWREKTLIFRGTDLTTALTELNRYLANPVDTSDPSLSTLNVSGTFSLEEPETTLSAIIDAFDLQYYKNPFDNKTRLYRR